MAVPRRPFTREEIDEAVRHARDWCSAELTDKAWADAVGFWVPLLVDRIDELESQRRGLFGVVQRRDERIAELERHNRLLSEVVKHTRTHFGCVAPGGDGMGLTLEEAFEALDEFEEAAS